jgi:hypothetical protein
MKRGSAVVLTKLPAGLLDGLPVSDQTAIRAIVGKPVILRRYDEDGRAELYFRDKKGVHHFLYVSASYVKTAP